MPKLKNSAVWCDRSLHDAFGARLPADAPAAAADIAPVETQESLFSVIAVPVLERGVAILMSTHTLEVAQAMCDRIGIIQGGVIRACGTMNDLRASAAAGATGLEDIFLRLTGENAARALVDVLNA